MHMTDPPDSPAADQTDFETFRLTDMRLGTVLEAAPLEGARKPSIRLKIDFGPGVGVKKSSAQITVHYEPGQLVGKQVLAVVNFPPRQIGKFMSEALTLGVPDANGDIVLISPDARPKAVTPNGARLV